MARGLTSSRTSAQASSLRQRPRCTANFACDWTTWGRSIRNSTAVSRCPIRIPPAPRAPSTPSSPSPTTISPTTQQGANGASKREKVSFKAGYAFHTFTFEADATSGEFKLFVKGEDKPLFIGRMPHHDEIVPGFQFGDGATDVKGSADLAYIGYTAE